MLAFHVFVAGTLFLSSILGVSFKYFERFQKHVPKVLLTNGIFTLFLAVSGIALSIEAQSSVLAFCANIGAYLAAVTLVHIYLLRSTNAVFNWQVSSAPLATSYLLSAGYIFSLI